MIYTKHNQRGDSTWTCCFTLLAFCFARDLEKLVDSRMSGARFDSELSKALEDRATHRSSQLALELCMEGFGGRLRINSA